MHYTMISVFPFVFDILYIEKVAEINWIENKFAVTCVRRCYDLVDGSFPTPDWFTLQMPV